MDAGTTSMGAMGLGPSLSSRLAPGGAALVRRQEDFSSTLARAHSSANTTPEQQAREAAEEFVSMALVQPLLAQLRETNHAAPPFKPTQGERQFQGLADAHIARQVVRSSRFPLVDRLARNLLEHGRKAKASALAPAETTP